MTTNQPALQTTDRRDRRSRRTRRCLKEALFSLVLEKGYDAVTIEDITNRADLGRTTFYLHYRDKDELLLESIDSIASDLIERLPQPEWFTPESGRPRGATLQDSVLVVFTHAAENAALYRVILRGEGALQASGRVHAIINQKATEMVQQLLEMGTVSISVPVEIFTNYLAGSLLALLTWWLEANMPYSPPEMAEMYQKMFFHGSKTALGFE